MNIYQINYLNGFIRLVNIYDKSKIVIEDGDVVKVNQDKIQEIQE
jgi:hypothetical protein